MSWSDREVPSPPIKLFIPYLWVLTVVLESLALYDHPHIQQKQKVAKANESLIA